MAKRMSKAARKKRAVRITLIVVIVVAVLAGAIGILRDQVTSQVNAGNDAALSAEVTLGSITNVVSGSGNLTDEDVEDITLHGSVEVEELLVEAGDTVKKGDLLATVNMSSVLSAMADVQSQLNDLDDEIGKASNDELEDNIKSTIAGRVIALYVAEGDDVSTVMYEQGALALLSMDGYLAVQVSTTALTVGEAVTVTDSNDVDYEGVVESVVGGTVTVLVSDEAPFYGDRVKVYSSEDSLIGYGNVTIHRQMKITGIAGTVDEIKVGENEEVSAGDTLFTLTDTSFSANYTSLLAQRTELEEKLQQLITIYQDGAVLASVSGTVSDLGSSSSSSSTGSYTFTGTQTATSSEQTLLSICPGTKMTVSISVDETDILSLELGQEATVTVDALNGDAVEGEVTQIDTTATSSGGVTVYTVTVTLDKIDNMLSGMSASVSIVIEGVDDALLIPSDALNQTSSTSYVYTAYDEETGELGGMVEVTTGLNNGSYVEITGGLSEGDTVYYFEKEDNSFGFGGMDFGGMGGFGGGDFGGGMPDFGGNGGGGMPGGFGGFGG